MSKYSRKVKHNECVHHEKSDLEEYKRMHLRIAKELCYPSNILELIKSAECENDVTRAMMKGRNRT